MKSKILKSIAVSSMVVLFTAIPATQALAWCGGGGCWGYGYGGGYYSQVTPQRYVAAPQSYTTVQTTQAPAKVKTNDFDPTIYDIQVVLYEKGYYEGEIDGLYESDTKVALLKFQEDNDINSAENSDIVQLKADKVTLKALGL